MSALSLRGPAWVTAREHRGALWTLAGLFTAATAYLVVQRLRVAAAVDAFAHTGCSVRNTTVGCGDRVIRFLDTELAFSHLVDYFRLGLIVLPVLVGAFVAGPMIARQLESGTYRMLWTQSVSPARCLAAQLATVTALTLVSVAVLSGVYHWAWSTGPQENYPAPPWFGWSVFNAGGTVPVAYVLLGIAVGALAGLLIRITVPAMAAAAAAVTACHLALSTLRTHLWPVRTVTGRSGTPVPLGRDALMVSRGRITSTGRHLPDSTCPGPHDVQQCWADHDVTGWYRTYHPASHFWPLQLMETGIVLAIAALVTAAAFQVLRRKHG
ncbi:MULTISPECIES: hypothetical protein [unclassified Streptomyces]|uniref:hypothetical protein n=1 Tax=unclassified Streptomyces TaxID=2593676 RepID=UPI002251397B|nr:hypothetical protein [Streptomyces sp. NBC_01500]MCX4549284.1 hypothetical protein [Streptomyces sp. NBC_01500]WSV54855.1 hypothetical protein OG282_14700 [Streptomyces sp. NBC_01014]